MIAIAYVVPNIVQINKTNDRIVKNSYYFRIKVAGILGIYTDAASGTRR